MPRRPRTIEEELAAAAREGAAVAGETIVDRSFDFFERMMSGANARSTRALPSDYLGGQFKCVANTPMICVGVGSVASFEMVHPTNGYGTCKRCFKFMWDSGVARLKQAARKQHGEAKPGGSGTQPAGTAAGAAGTGRRKPWDILGVTIDASEDEIKRAYRKLVLEHHPDMVPAGAPSEEREAARLLFEEITRAKDAMLSVRKAAS